jgi:hypothetical protein
MSGETAPRKALCDLLNDVHESLGMVEQFLNEHGVEVRYVGEVAKTINKLYDAAIPMVRHFEKKHNSVGCEWCDRYVEREAI